MRNLSLLFFILVFTAIQTYSQDTIHVPADYTTIQAGIDAAQNGDLVLVDDGTYLENIKQTKDLKIVNVEKGAD